MITFKGYISESFKVHPELAAHGIDTEAVKKYLRMRKTELDDSGLESRGEKMKHTRAKNSFFNHLYKIHNGDENKVKMSYHKISMTHDTHGEKSLYEENDIGYEGTDKLTAYRKKMTPGEKPVTPNMLPDFEDLEKINK